MTKVIMLDIDDVVSSDRSILACTEFDEETALGYQIPQCGDHVALGLINRACKIRGAKVVVISTWLQVVGWKYTQEWLARNGLDPANFHEDPATRFGPRATKRGAIQDWLERHPETTLEMVCVVDDDESLFEQHDRLRGRQVVVDGVDGICLRHFWHIVKMLAPSEQAPATKE